MIRDTPDFPHDAASLAKARTELPGEVSPELFREPLLRAAWLAVVAELADWQNPTPETVCARLAGEVQPDDLPDLLRLLTYARDYAEGLRGNGRIYFKLLLDSETQWGLDREQCR